MVYKGVLRIGSSMKKIPPLQLVVSNSTRNLYQRCMLADPLLALLGSFKLQRLLYGIAGEPPYVDFADYCRRISRGDCRTNGTLDELILSTVKNYFFAQLTKAFVNAPRIWKAFNLELGEIIEQNQTRIKAALLEDYPRELAEIILAHHLAPSIDSSATEIDARGIH